VRLSGPAALEIAGALFEPSGGAPLAALPGFRRAEGRLRDGGLPCSLYLMRAPRSYTREDVVELHLPGNPLVAESVLEAALERGARPAGPGEFTRRALASGRISPAGAEAVVRLVGARSREELVAAAEGLAGRAGREISAWRERAEELAAALEAELDYAETAGEFLDDARAAEGLAALSSGLDALLAAEGEESRGAADAGLVRAVLAGPVNAGKSLLFRRLTGRDALVSELPGTTRDVIEAPLLAAPGDLALVDCAGLGATPGEVEVLAGQAAERAWRSSDVMLLVLDRAGGIPAAELEPALTAARGAEIPVVVVLNKCDLPAPADAGAAGALPASLRPLARAEVSALTGQGCAELAAELAGLVRGGSVRRSPARTEARARRREVLRGARGCLGRAGEALAGGLGLACAADDLREAVRAVALYFEPGAGRAELDDGVLDRIFARFCVGK
jgi:tRNA modification GTPase